MVPIDVTAADSPFANVDLEIKPSVGDARVVRKVDFSAERPLRIAVYLPEKATGTVQFSASARDGTCVVGTGVATASGVLAGNLAAVVTLAVRHVTVCDPPLDGGTDAGGAGHPGGAGGAGGGAGLGGGAGSGASAGGPGNTGGVSSGGVGGGVGGVSAWAGAAGGVGGASWAFFAQPAATPATRASESTTVHRVSGFIGFLLVLPLRD